MGLGGALERKGLEIGAGRVAKRAEEGKLGKALKTAWEFFSGWKSFIVACVAMWKLMCHDCATSIGYVDAILKGVGWDTVQAAFDPSQGVLALLFLVAVWHKLRKAYLERRAGVPFTLLQSSVAPAAVTNVTTKELPQPPRVAVG